MKGSHRRDHWRKYEELIAVEFSSNKISIVGVTEMGAFWGWQCKDLRNSRRKLATLGRKIRDMMGSSWWMNNWIHLGRLYVTLENETRVFVLRLGCCHLFGSFHGMVRSNVAQQEKSIQIWTAWNCGDCQSNRLAKLDTAWVDEFRPASNPIDAGDADGKRTNGRWRNNSSRLPFGLVESNQPLPGHVEEHGRVDRQVWPPESSPWWITTNSIDRKFSNEKCPECRTIGLQTAPTLCPIVSTRNNSLLLTTGWIRRNPIPQVNEMDTWEGSYKLRNILDRLNCLYFLSFDVIRLISIYKNL